MVYVLNILVVPNTFVITIKKLKTLCTDILMIINHFVINVIIHTYFIHAFHIHRCNMNYVVSQKYILVIDLGY